MIKDKITTLSYEERVTLLEKLLQRTPATNLVAIKHQSTNNGIYPLSFAQNRLWFFDQLTGSNNTYNIPCAVHLMGALNYPALEKALDFLMQRHDILRTSFRCIEGKPEQVVAARIPINHIISIIDVNATEINEYALQEADKPFNLTQPPLFRVRLLRQNSTEHVLLLTLHHIIADAWSLKILIDDLSCAYNAYINNEEPALPALSVQYGDYSVWQQDTLKNSQVLTSQLDYWRDHLKDINPLMNLPMMRHKTKEQRYHGQFHISPISPTLSQELRAFCKAHKITLYSFFLSVFNILLQRYCGQSTIVVGTPVSNRSQAQLTKLIGFFINNVVMKNKIDSDQTTLEFIKVVQENTNKALDNREVPFDWIINDINPERNLSYTPFYQIEFALQPHKALDINLAHLTTKTLVFNNRASKVELGLSIEESDRQFIATFEYNTDLFDESFIKALATHFQILLESMLTRSDAPIKTLSMLTKEEQLQMLSISKGKTIKLEKNYLLFFANQVRITPHNIAVQDHVSSLTYDELDKQSNQIAHYLLSHSIGKGQTIALLLSRNPSCLSSMIATLKIGAVLVPFNPQSNLERNLILLHQLKPDVILTEQTYSHQVSTVPFKIIVIESLCFATLSRAAINTTINLDDLAYLMYTSGSTGLPKAAMVSHRGMINHLLAKINDLEITPHDVVAQIAVQTFDVFIWQFLVASMIGGQCIVLTNEAAWEPEHLLQAAADYKITVLESVPSHLEMLLRELEKNQNHLLATLRCLITNGEPMPTAQCLRWFDQLPNILFINAYGPTECSDDVTHLILHKKPTFAYPYLPLGHVIQNTQLHILSEEMQLVPMGVPGELSISGDCVGLGYFNDPTRTNISFVHSPFDSTKSSKLYKTGDLVRYREDGSLEYLGRKDFQLKIHGCRVEPGEIEAILKKYPRISQAMVVANQTDNGNRTLIAYVIADVHPGPTSQTLQSHCKKYLPDYMVPSSFVLLDAFPLLENGKINRDQLPEPYFFQPAKNQETMIPSNPLENNLCTIWADVLGVEKVGLTDSFFQMGGHSLLAVELVSRMREILGESISVNLLFNFPTISGLLHAIKEPSND